MQDRPTLDELLEAVARYLREDVMVNTTGRTQFHGRVAMNAVEMVRREIGTIEEHYAREWDGLDHVLGTQPMPPRLAEVREGLLDRNRQLSERIREGHADGGEFRHSVFNHLRKVIHDKLTVSNPALAAEQWER
jgi:hypothetical protein